MTGIQAKARGGLMTWDWGCRLRVAVARPCDISSRSPGFLKSKLPTIAAVTTYIQHQCEADQTVSWSTRVLTMEAKLEWAPKFTQLV